jgi:hypothetical protein
MELYVLGTLAGIGYLLGKDNKNKDDNLTIQKNESPSMDNIYSSQHTSDVDKKIRRKAKRSNDKAYNFKQTGVIPNNLKEIGENNNKINSSLAGVEIPIEEFKHNNMVPFFGGSVKQNVDPFRTHSTLERYTGVTDLFQNKKEIAPLNDTGVSVGNVYGMESTIDFEQERYINSTFKNNILPFQQVRVGVGLNNGTDSTPTGGFQQDTRVFELDKTVDELRVLTNPKNIYGGRVIDGQKPTTRAEAIKVSKNRVETFSEQDPDQYLTTTGAYTKETERPCQVLKDTSRKDTSTEYKGTAYNNNEQEARPDVKDTLRQQFSGYGVRNGDGTYIGKDEDDYGKANILVYNNERDITSVKTYEGNLTTLVKSIIAPLQDIMKLTPKEYTVQAERPLGNLQPQFPNKLTIYDPNDICRTTIKETAIHDESIGNLTSECKKSVVYDPDEIAKTTIRETLNNDDTTINLKLNVPKTIVYDPTDIAKTTINELTEDGTRTGFINRTVLQDGEAYKTNIYKAKNRNIQFQTGEYKGGIEYIRGGGDGYKVENFDAKATNKQFTSLEDYTGVAESKDKKNMSRQDIYNMLVNDVKETLLYDRVPTTQGPKNATDITMINVEPTKLQVSNVNDNIYGNYQGGIAPKGAHSIVDNIEHDLEFTKYKPRYENYASERLDSSLLDAFKNNEFTQSLNSAPRMDMHC